MDLKRHNWILVDYENVQAVEFARRKGLPVSVVLFVGPNQTKRPMALMGDALESKCHLEIVHLEQQGKHALDLLIAFRAGEILTRDSHACVQVLSGDTGFDPLLKHIAATNRFCSRVASFAELSIPRLATDAPVVGYPEPRVPTPLAKGKVALSTEGKKPVSPASCRGTVVEERVKKATEYLRKNVRNRPKKMAKLMSLLGTLFAHKLATAAMDEVFVGMLKTGAFKVGEKGMLEYLI